MIALNTYRKNALKGLFFSFVIVASALGVACVPLLLQGGEDHGRYGYFYKSAFALVLLFIGVSKFFYSLLGFLLGMPIKDFDQKMQPEPLWKKLLLGVFGGLTLVVTFLGILYLIFVRLLS